MLQRLEVENFLALRDVAIDLEPFTVLVGANASGKSTILEALHRVCSLRSGNPQVLIEGKYDIAPTTKGTKKTSPLSPKEILSYLSKEEKIIFTPTVEKTKHPVTVYFKGSDLRRGWFIEAFVLDEEYTPKHSLLLEGYARSFFPKNLLIQANFSSLSKPSHSPLKTPILERDGSGLGTVCQYLQQELPDAFARVQEHLASVIKGLKRFRIRRADATAKNYVNLEPDPNWTGIAEELIFDFDDAVGVPAKYVSEGTLLVLCILVAAARFEGDALILIDDLERGLHPKAVRDLIQALRKLQEINPKLQIVATSHSPYILDELQPQEVRVIARDPERGTVVGRLTDHPQFNKWKDTMSPGEFWSHVGEDWLLKQPELA